MDMVEKRTSFESNVVNQEDRLKVAQTIHRQLVGVAAESHQRLKDLSAQYYTAIDQRRAAAQAVDQLLYDPFKELDDIWGQYTQALSRVGIKTARLPIPHKPPSWQQAISNNGDVLTGKEPVTVGLGRYLSVVHHLSSSIDMLIVQHSRRSSLTLREHVGASSGAGRARACRW